MKKGNIHEAVPGRMNSRMMRTRMTLEIVSEGAVSINLGFTRYRMPEGGTLRIQPTGHPSPYRAFTDLDNEEHGQLEKFRAYALPDETWLAHVRDRLGSRLVVE